MTLREMQQKRTALQAERTEKAKARNAVAEKAVAEDRGLTADEKAQRDTLTSEIDALDVRIAEANSAITEKEAVLEAERTAPAAADPDAAMAVRAAAAAGVSRIEVVDMTKKPGYFGRQLQAVYRFATNGGSVANLEASDRDLLKPMMAAATGANTDVGSEGGFLVAQDRTNDVLQRAYMQGEILRRVNRQPISAGSNGIKLPAIDETSRADGSRFGGIVSGWLGQAGTLSAGKPKFRELDLKLRKVGAFVYATDELMADAVAFEAWVNRNLPLELTFRVEDAIVNGNGSAQPIGILNSGAAISVSRSSASRILSEDLRNMYARLWAPLRGRAVFLVDQSSESEFDSLSIPIGTGGSFDPSYRPAGFNGAQYASYKNIPIIPVEYCAALGTAGDIVLAAFDEYLLIDKGGVEQAVSMHVQFLAAEQVFRFMYRVDGQLTWNSALTPKSGGSTLSCVVSLAA